LVSLSVGPFAPKLYSKYLRCGPLKRVNIFHHNSCISRWIFTLYVPMETEMNALYSSCKIYNFTLALSLIAAMLSAVRDDCGRPLPAVRSIELIVLNNRMKSSNVCLTRASENIVSQMLWAGSGRFWVRYAQ